MTAGCCQWRRLFAFSSTQMAAFEIHMLGLASAHNDYLPETIAAAEKWDKSTYETE